MRANITWGKFEGNLKLIGKGLARHVAADPSFKFKTGFAAKDFLLLMKKA